MDNILEISRKSLMDLRLELEALFGEEWLGLEDETLSLELDIAFDEVLLGKIRFLRVMEEDPDRFYDDVVFFLHSCDIINNMPVDPEIAPMPGSLELAYAIEEVGAMYPYEGVISRDIRKAVTYLLNEEGYSVPVPPFTFVKPEDLSPGQTESDTNNKERAIRLYISSMKEGHA